MKTTNGSRLAARRTPSSVAERIQHLDRERVRRLHARESAAAAAAAACWPRRSSRTRPLPSVLKVPDRRWRSAGRPAASRSSRAGGRKAAMLAERHRVPDRVLVARPRRARTSEVPQQRKLEAAHVSPAARQPDERARQGMCHARRAAERKRRSKPLPGRVPRSLIQLVDDVEPVRQGRSGTRGYCRRGRKARRREQLLELLPAAGVAWLPRRPGAR